MTAPHTALDRISGVALDLLQVSRNDQSNGDSRRVLDALTLRIEPGEMVAVLGPRGCGKSTLLRLVAGIETPSAGSILLDGIATTAAPHLVLSRDPGLASYETVHSRLTAVRDRRPGTATTAPQVDQALRWLKACRFAGANVRELSAATAQRVSLATGLVHDPRLLLLDDPFLRLDPIARIALQAELVSLWQRCGFTALFATNDVDEALTIASRIIVLGRQPARSVMDLTLDCEFPRRLTETGLARTRRVLLQALENAGASATTRTFAPRRAVQSTRQGNPAPMVWPQDGLAAHVQERVSQTPFV